MFSMNFILIYLHLIISVHSSDNGDGRGADARSTEVSVGCLSSETQIQLINGKSIRIDQLKSGDELKTISHENENLQLKRTEMILMIDRNEQQIVKFYVIRSSSGHEISLTTFHLIPVVTLNETIEYKSAQNVRLNEKIFVFDGTNVRTSSIVEIRIEMKKGFFAPLTTSGTLMGNGILLSCYSLVKDHHFTHQWLKPIRFFYRISRIISSISLKKETLSSIDSRNEGIHWIFNWIYQSVLFLYPSAFQIH